jgi:uncharacterized protein (DUF3084 family)
VRTRPDLAQEEGDLAVLLDTSRQLMQEMQGLGAQLRKLAEQHTALGKRHSALVEAMRRLKTKARGG